MATQAIIKRVEEIAQKRNISMAQVSVAWILFKEGVTAPIIGTTKLENLHDIIGEFMLDHLGLQLVADVYVELCSWCQRHADCGGDQVFGGPI